VVSRCEFDRDAVLVPPKTAKRLLRGAGLGSIDRRYILFFPWSSRGFRLIERSLGWLPLGAQYCIFGRKQRSGSDVAVAG
jgi:hypothetical protein